MSAREDPSRPLSVSLSVEADLARLADRIAELTALRLAELSLARGGWKVDREPEESGEVVDPPGVEGWRPPGRAER